MNRFLSTRLDSRGVGAGFETAAVSEHKRSISIEDGNRLTLFEFKL
jgi:hypothetical protein